MIPIWNPWTVTLSYIVAVIASYVALDMAGRITRATSRRTSFYWLLGGSLAMGVGIWSMHFVGMLAMRLPIVLTFDLGITLLSLVLPILASALALYTVSRPRVDTRVLLSAGTVMGVGIALMHYTGMAAIEIRPRIQYTPSLFALSIVIAIGASVTALWLSFRLRSSATTHHVLKRSTAALVMGAAIAGMHYVGMAAANFAPDSWCLPEGLVFHHEWLSLTIGISTLVLLCTTLLVSVFDARLEERTELLHKTQRSNQKLEMRVAERTAELQKLNRSLAAARDEAVRAAAVKSDFLANMSHEIRTPMNAVIGMTSVLLDSELTRDQREWVEVIRSSGQHLLTIINDILDFSKIEAGKVVLESMPLSVRDCVEGVMDLATVDARAKGVEIGYLVRPTVPEAIVGDVGRLRQVLLNLVANAVKFTPAKGEVFVDVDARPVGDLSEITFSVRDTGIGITPDQQARLFQPFSQGDTSTTRTHGGTGLGLSISKRLVEMMGGQLWCDSTPGRGSTFHFSIPAEPTFIEVAAREKEIAQVRGRKVLIVKANAVNRKVLEHHCSSWGMQVVATGSSHDALHFLERGDRFDVALVDHQMPDMDGIELARQLRELHGDAALPVIMLSANPPKDLEPGLIAATLLKPIKPSRLFDTVITLVQKTVPLSPSAAKFELPVTLAEEHPLRILVAEDNVVNQKVAKLMLNRMGYEPDFVANGLEAVEAVDRQLYDVVFMDVQMPVMDGLAATRELRTRHARGRMPRIIGVSASAMVEDRLEAQRAGMDDYVTKPISAPELVAALRRSVRIP